MALIAIAFSEVSIFVGMLGTGRLSNIYNNFSFSVIVMGLVLYGYRTHFLSPILSMALIGLSIFFSAMEARNWRLEIAIGDLNLEVHRGKGETSHGNENHNS